MVWPQLTGPACAVGAVIAKTEQMRAATTAMRPTMALTGTLLRRERTSGEV
jgi:hypothetical protein